VTGYLVVTYLVVGTAVATEVLLRIRAHWLKTHYTYAPDAEDLAVTVLAGVAWPLTLVVGFWFWLYTWREARRGPAAEG
jgi:H+/Cl- antiporter ClcA